MSNDAIWGLITGALLGWFAHKCVCATAYYLAMYSEDDE